MSQQTLIDTAKASVEAYNEKNWDEVTKVLAPNVVYKETGSNRSLHGISDVLTAWKGWGVAFPDSKATFDAVHVSGDDTVILELTWRGTHTGPMGSPAGDIPATGKSIETRACQVIQIADGKVQSIHQYLDLATMMTQLGLSGA
jgi:steroid delta-isomerase-like uncharacterized protein